MFIRVAGRVRRTTREAVLHIIAEYGSEDDGDSGSGGNLDADPACLHCLEPVTRLLQTNKSEPYELAQVQCSLQGPGIVAFAWKKQTP